MPGRNIDSLEVMKLINYAKIFPSSADSTAWLYNKLAEHTRKKGIAYGMVTIMLDLSRICANQGKYREGLTILHQSLPYCVQSEAAGKLLTFVYNNMGNLHLLMGNYMHATRYFYQAIMYAEKNPGVKGIEFAYANLVGVFNMYNKLPEALQYLEKAEKIAIRENNQELVENIMIGKGIIYIRQKKWEQAERQLLASLRWADTDDRPQLRARAAKQLASLYLSTGKPSKALTYIEMACRTDTTLIPSHEQVHLMITLGETYAAQHRNADAEKVLLKALERTRQLNMSAKTAAINDILADLYARMGKYEQAFRHNREVLAQINDLRDKETAHDLNQLDVKYRTAEKDKELFQKQLLIAGQEQRLKEKNMWILGITSAVLVSSLLLAGVYRNNRHRQQISQLKATMSGEEKERARIARDLHDGIGGMLASLKMHFSALPVNHQALGHASDYREAMHILDETAAEVRITAHNLMPELLLRYGFAEAMRIFCTKAGKGKNLVIDFQCLGTNGQLDSNTELSLYRMLQELVQNIVKHAQATHALVQVNLHGKTLDILVEDNGKGMDPQAQWNGMGLASLKQRVTVMNGAFDLESMPGKGTTVYLQFDLNKIKRSS